MIAETFINRPVTAIVVSIVIALLGGICVMTLPVNQYPKITPPAVSVSANYTGADAITVEQTVATPVEEAINGVKGMEYIQSNSTSTGMMSVNATFKVGTNVDIATLDVQNRVGIAKPLLPSTVSRLGLTVRARNISALMMVALYSPKGTHNITPMLNLQWTSGSTPTGGLLIEPPIREQWLPQHPQDAGLVQKATFQKPARGKLHGGERIQTLEVYNPLSSKTPTGRKRAACL